MLRTISLFLFICALALCFSSCSSDEDEVVEQETEVTLSVSSTSVSVATAGESFTITVTCNTSYSVSVSDDWLTLDSDDSGTLTFTAAENSSENSRDATITVTAEDVSETVTVEQAGLSLSVSPTSVSVSAAGETFTVTVTCDIDYSVEVSDDWLTLNSDDSGTLTFTADENSSEDSRTATITITAGNVSVKVEVTQAVADDSGDDGNYSGTTINGYEYVDLGLSVKWATCNVGADSSEGYGNYYAWGETTTKSSYTVANNDTYGVSLNDISGNAEYDAATANWGSTWRMPKYSEITELINNCTWTWTTLNEINGYEVTSTNGNSIFLPAAGYYSYSSLSSRGSAGYYWTSLPYTSDTDTSYINAYYFSFYSGGGGMAYCGRRFGLSVRPVSD